MPELPDVENFRKYLEKTSLHQTILSIKVNQTRILDHISPQQLKRALVGTQFTETFRHGKHLFAKTADSEWLTMHFGMTGFLRYFDSLSENPAHDRLLISFENGNFLAFVNQRMFGRVGLSDSPEDYIKEHNLGPDALHIEKGQFLELIAGKKTPVKAVLMNQKLISGVGNEYSDEILFQARIHPLRKTDTLNAGELSALYNSTKRVLEIAVELDADKDSFPDSFMLKNRGKARQCPGCGKMEMVKLSGRSAYFCPDCQF